MASRRLIVPAAVLLVLACSFSPLVWFTNEYILQGDSGISTLEHRASFLAASLAEFQFDHPRHRRRQRSFNNGNFKDNQTLNGCNYSPIGVLCGGCYHAVANPQENLRCGHLIHKLIQKEGLSLIDAAQRVATSEYSEPCARCHPDACTAEDERIYWRYDSPRSVPPVLSSSVPQLASIPEHHRIPSLAMPNLTAFFSSLNHAVPHAQYLFDYNPSIVILPPIFWDTNNIIFPPPSQLPRQQDDDDRPAYLASFRVSTQQSCFHPYETKAMYGGSWDNKPSVKDYLALAFLSPNLSVMMDVVVDVKESGVFSHFAQDFRLFVLRGRLYVASFDLISPLVFTNIGSGEDRHSEEFGSNRHFNSEEFVNLKNVFPSSLKVALRRFPSCPVCPNRPNNHCGKNLNYFSSDSLVDKPHDIANNNIALVELWPSGPHVVQEVNLDSACSVSRKMSESNQQVTASSLQSFSDADLKPPTTAWNTMEELMFPNLEPSETLLARGRGGACCISIQEPGATESHLLVGIFHTKIPKFGKRSGKRLPLWVRNDNNTATKVLPNQYLSRWYAFRPDPPFQVVAQSGLFCLGYPESQQELNNQPLIKTTQWKKMYFGGDAVDPDTTATGDQSLLILDCPRIHFVSGISEKAGDSSRVLVAYGVNDCFSRLVEVEKTAIVRALFPPSTS